MTVDDPDMRQLMLQARESARVLTTFGLALMGSLLAIETMNIIEKRHKLYKNRTIRNTVATLYGSSVFGVACIAGICASWWSNWTGSDAACSVYIKLVSVIFYLVMKQFIYMLLFVRMKLVHEAFNLNGFFMRMVRWAVFLNVLFGVPIVFYPLAVVFFDGYVTLDGICVQYTTSRYPVVLFTLGDVTLSLCLLILFIAPLTRHSRKAHETKTAIMGIARRNLLVSALMMISTIGSLTYMAVDSTPVDPHDLSDQQIHTQVFGIVDVICSATLSHFLCSSWLPDRLYRVLMIGCLHGNEDTSLAMSPKAVMSSSVYVQSNTELDALPRLESAASPKRSTIAQLDKAGDHRLIIVGHDTIIAHGLGQRASIRWSSFTAQPFFRILGLSLFIGIEASDVLVLVGVLPTLTSIVCGGLLVIITSLASTSWLSLSIVNKLLRKQTILLRMFFWCLYMVFYNLVMQDERIVMGMGHCLFILMALFSDAYVKEASGTFALLINCAACLMLVKRFILLQFDLIQPRFNDRVYIFGNLMVWSIYQAARDFGSALLALMLKDLLKQHHATKTATFTHIQAAVIVRIIGLATEAKMERVNPKIMKRFGGIGLSSRTMTHTLKASNEVESGVLTLRERDSLAIRWFGRTKGETLLRFLGRPWVRWISRTILASCLFTYVCLVLPGLLPQWVSFLMLGTLLPSFRSLLLKNWALIRALVEQLDFVIEAVFALSVLGLFGAMMKDARIAALPMLFLMWLDFRLNDAQCVFYHSQHRGETYQRSKTIFWGYAMVTIVLVLSLLAFPMMLVMQLVTNVDSNLGFNLRGVEVNMTSQVLDEQQGAYAQVRLYQYVSDFLLTFAVVATIDLLVDMIRKPKSQVSLKYFRAPVKRVCVDGFVNEGSSLSKKNNPCWKSMYL